MTEAVELPDGGVALSARACSALRHLVDRVDLEIRARQDGVQLPAWLVEAVTAIDRAGRSFPASFPGKPELDRSGKPGAPLETMSTTAAAERLGTTRQGVGKACRENRLQAAKTADGYRITEDALAAFAAGRKR